MLSFSGTSHTPTSGDLWLPLNLASKITEQQHRHFTLLQTQGAYSPTIAEYNAHLAHTAIHRACTWNSAPVSAASQALQPHRCRLDVKLLSPEDLDRPSLSQEESCSSHSSLFCLSWLLPLPALLRENVHVWILVLFITESTTWLLARPDLTLRQVHAEAVAMLGANGDVLASDATDVYRGRPPTVIFRTILASSRARNSCRHTRVVAVCLASSAAGM
ncbi:unnamed protein product [Diplocarpon coronariae]|nr:hypothetical protein JHW43_009397 [Diplocarpon mali]